ncbi:ATP-dependent DNA helicase RecG [Candidatus Nanopelagicus limnes]|uniref:ATP-dependent DNA helicase RecG n=1 Tax=Candidatus Nanopelagicus limnae TaxID=1884634 RepID=A0A249JYA0_9ACTN|nr:ATP-dependent DNA helicase RecG [Candidatus Nanopelagicus limnes]ASY09513.1 ATP-dependent DNA helicase RecG [Candidatus Nanopelagicus limnes]
MATLSTRLTNIVGDRTAQVLEKSFGITTINELLRHYPRRYVVRGELTDISTLVADDEVTILAEIEAVKLRRANGKNILEVVVTDGSANLSLTFFNQAWREKDLRSGRVGLFAGKVGVFKGRRQLAHPDYQLIPDGDDVDAAVAEFAGKYLPVYPATGKLPSWKIMQCMKLAIDSLDELPDYLPSQITEQFRYPSLKKAFLDIHQPPDLDSAENARQRLTFDEALLLQLLLVQRRAEITKLSTKSRTPNTPKLVAAFEKKLPFKYTAGQIEVNSQIEKDLSNKYPMHRLLQGEVGSGKTVVALRAMLSVVDSSGQAALLAPTEVLAQQHYRTITKILGELAQAGTLQAGEIGTQVELLTGSLSAAEKKEIHAKLATGQTGIVIGTHALISDGVGFDDLGLVVVDEQHRFGVEQRDALRMKAKQPPHLLVMTATPIPRTVAMTVFGDLDISTLKELPSGRVAITTHVIPVLEKPHFLDRAWQRVKEEVAEGHQVYIVAPRIANPNKKLTEREIAAALLLGEELLDNEEMVAVEELAPQLSSAALSGLKIAVLHGKQSSETKDQTMAAFAAGQIQVLIATTVIEVGVDVPNASMMVIMDADRFGVSQLHQLRGRVGRGSAPGLCLLVSSAQEDSPAMQRLNSVAATLDGFELARIDLEQRKEGDVLGRSQSGGKSHLRLLRVLRDESLIDQAREVAVKILKTDPDLSNLPELNSEVEKLKLDEAARFMDKS